LTTSSFKVLSVGSNSGASVLSEASVGTVVTGGTVEWATVAAFAVPWLMAVRATANAAPNATNTQTTAVPTTFTE
jgi:hypothetical protein